MVVLNYFILNLLNSLIRSSCSFIDSLGFLCMIISYNNDDNFNSSTPICLTSFTWLTAHARISSSILKRWQWTTLSCFYVRKDVFHTFPLWEKLIKRCFFNQVEEILFISKLLSFYDDDGYWILSTAFSVFEIIIWFSSFILC